MERSSSNPSIFRRASIALSRIASKAALNGFKDGGSSIRTQLNVFCHLLDDPQIVRDGGR
jgi:hypothetical protein